MQSTSTTDQATELLKTRLAEIDSERVQIEGALAALSPNGTTARRVGRPKGSRSKGRTRRSGSKRADQAIELIRKNPGITASEIAKTMKIKPNYLYRVLGELEKRRVVKKKGRTYEIGAPSSAARAARSGGRKAKAAAKKG